MTYQPTDQDFYDVFDDREDELNFLYEQDEPPKKRFPFGRYDDHPALTAHERNPNLK